LFLRDTSPTHIHALAQTDSTPMLVAGYPPWKGWLFTIQAFSFGPSAGAAVLRGGLEAR
jgi:hypothetical protein